VLRRRLLTGWGARARARASRARVRVRVRVRDRVRVRIGSPFPNPNPNPNHNPNPNPNPTSHSGGFTSLEVERSAGYHPLGWGSRGEDASAHAQLPLFSSLGIRRSPNPDPDPDPDPDPGPDFDPNPSPSPTPDQACAGTLAPSDRVPRSPPSRVLRPAHRPHAKVRVRVGLGLELG